MMAVSRKLIKIETPRLQPGFLGAGHTARPVIQGSFAESDPFIMLMDDILDKQDNEPAGGPHPHAGFETVSLLLEGSIGDEVHQMKAGDFQVMTAGSGVIHSETIEEKTRMRLLQLWLDLPKDQRWVQPRVQDISENAVPKAASKGVGIKVYSGSFAGVSSPVSNYVPMIVADIQLEANATLQERLPASFNTFLYVLEGNVLVGDDATALSQDQVGWLDKFPGSAESELRLKAGDAKTRLILYAGEPQGDRIVSYGPFIGDTQDDIIRLYQDYRQGKMPDISGVGEDQRIKY